LEVLLINKLAMKYWTTMTRKSSISHPIL